MPLLALLRATRATLLPGAGAYLADPTAALSVLRAVPDGDAPATATITVTFDRPVAGSLDRTVDPTALLSVSPAVAGIVDWRDPVTLRLRPAAPLVPNTVYRVSVANSFEAMDGSRLTAPYAFTFRVRGPRVLAGAPVSAHEEPRYLRPDTQFDLVVDAAVDLAAVSRLAHLELAGSCSTPGVVRLRATTQRAIAAADPWPFREAGGWDRARAADGLRRVVHLVPERPIHADGAAVRFRIVSPADGDRYRVPPGVDARARRPPPAGGAGWRGRRRRAHDRRVARHSSAICAIGSRLVVMRLSACAPRAALRTPDSAEDDECV